MERGNEREDETKKNRGDEGGGDWLDSKGMRGRHSVYV